MKQEFKIIEVFNSKEPDIKDVLKSIFVSYISKKINSENDLNKSQSEL